MDEMIKKTKKKVKVAHYQEVVNKTCYCNDGDSFYKTLTREIPDGTPTPMSDITIQYSDLGTDIVPEWRNRDLTRIIEDGNGFDVYFSGVKSARLDYCQAMELMLAFGKHYQKRETGSFVRVPPPRKKK